MCSRIYNDPWKKVSKLRGKISDVKEKILVFVQNNPSTHLRKIKNTLGYSMGTTQYHIQKLENEGRIYSQRNGFYKNYYHVGENLQKNELMQILNLESPRKIILYLLQFGPTTHGNLSNSVGLASSTVSWHMKKLIELDVINLKYNGKFSIYSIKNKDQIIPLLRKYKSSTWNDMIDNMSDIFSAFQE